MSIEIIHHPQTNDTVDVSAFYDNRTGRAFGRIFAGMRFGFNSCEIARCFLVFYEKHKEQGKPYIKDEFLSKFDAWYTVFNDVIANTEDPDAEDHLHKLIWENDDLKDLRERATSYTKCERCNEIKPAGETDGDGLCEHCRN